MKDRIRKIMESKHMTQQVFAEFIGTTSATLSGIFNGRTKPTLNIVDLLLEKFPDIDPVWLLRGQGAMYQNKTDGQQPLSTATPDTDGGSTPQPPSEHLSSAISQSIPFDFGTVPQALAAVAGHSSPTQSRQANFYGDREQVKNLDKPQRKITEIRVFYDDQTWESFMPPKK